jgi:hypothetical protein
MIALSKMPPHWVEPARAERRAERAAAKAFAEACAAGDPEALHYAASTFEGLEDGWRLAFREVAKLPAVAPAAQDRFLHLWLSTKELPRRVGDPKTLVAGLRKLFPRPVVTEPMLLYRGAEQSELRRRKGFSWTVRIEKAREFAERFRNWEKGGVVLETVAPPEAILLVRGSPDPEYYDESEVVVDPFLLGTVRVVERHRSAEPWRPPAAEVAVSKSGMVILRSAPTDNET